MGREQARWGAWCRAWSPFVLQGASHWVCDPGIETKLRERVTAGKDRPGRKARLLALHHSRASPSSLSDVIPQMCVSGGDWICPPGPWLTSGGPPSSSGPHGNHQQEASGILLPGLCPPAPTSWPARKLPPPPPAPCWTPRGPSLLTLGPALRHYPRPLPQHPGPGCPSVLGLSPSAFPTFLPLPVPGPPAGPPEGLEPHLPRPPTLRLGSRAGSWGTVRAGGGVQREGL